MSRQLLQRQLQPHSSLAAAILPDELMVEIISWLPVKPLLRFRCINKFFKTLIFDPHFVQMHFNRSSRNPRLALMQLKEHCQFPSSLVTLSIPRLLQNQIPGSSTDFVPIKARVVVGSCNGLLCLLGNSYEDNQLICFCNPAMRTKSKYFTMLLDSKFRHYFKFSFGYDNSTCTYKAVAFGVKMNYDGSNPTSVVKVFTLGDNCWRDIQSSCPSMLPLISWRDEHANNGVHLNGTINWLAGDGDYIKSNNGISSKDSSVVIVSLDLSSETHTRLSLPWGSEKVQRPKLVVLMDCLCSCRNNVEKTHFVIWKMKDFGVQDSWIQLFKFSYEDFFSGMDLLPLYLSKNGDTLVLANEEIDEAFMYNCKDNSVKEFEISSTNLYMWAQAKVYAESLVSTD